METMLINKVDKYIIPNLSFKKEEVLNSPEQRSLRWQDLHRALSLGNLYKCPVTIRFETSNGQIMETEGTVWAVTESYVIMKKDMRIPIACIHEVTI